MRRVHALDGLRGGLAMLVVAVHVCNLVYPNPFLMLSQIPVGIFFVLSGLVLTRAYDGRFLTFLAARFVRLWPVYAVTLAVGYGLAWRMPIWLEFIWVPWPQYDGDVINGPIWSLIIEAWAAFFMPVIAWSGGGRPVRSLAVGLAFLLGARLFPPLLFGCLFVLGARMSGTAMRNRLLESGPAQWLGKVSYSLYLSHWLVLKACTMLLGTPGIFLGVPVSLAVAWGIWKFVEHPSIALSREISTYAPAVARAT